MNTSFGYLEKQTSLGSRPLAKFRSWLYLALIGLVVVMTISAYVCQHFQMKNKKKSYNGSQIHRDSDYTDHND